MSDPNKATSESLRQVYAARDPAEAAAGYDTWAETYDAEMAQAGYRHPAVGLALMARHLPPGTGPVLDAGAGTGLTGELLAILGFGPLVGLDISPGMLARAASKGVYADLVEARLGDPLPFDDARFAAVISTGVFTSGHVGFEAMAELLRVTRPGGRIVLTIKDAVWREGFAEGAAGLCATGSLRLLEETPSYVSMPGVPDTSPGRACVWERLGAER